MSGIWNPGEVDFGELAALGMLLAFGVLPAPVKAPKGIELCIQEGPYLGSPIDALLAGSLTGAHLNGPIGGALIVEITADEMRGSSICTYPNLIFWNV